MKKLATDYKKCRGERLCKPTTGWVESNTSQLAKNQGAQRDTQPKIIYSTFVGQTKIRSKSNNVF